MYLFEFLRLIEELREFDFPEPEFKQAINLLIQVAHKRLDKIRYKEAENQSKPKNQSNSPKFSPAAKRAIKKLIENEKQYQLASSPEELRKMLKCNRSTFEQIRPYIEFPFNIEKLKKLFKP